MAHNLSIIVPVAGAGKRFRSNTPKCLSEVSGQTILSFQLRILRKIFPGADVVVVVGFGADKVLKHIPPSVRVVENEFYEETNVSRSLDMALRATQCDAALIVYGDILFNAETFKGFPGRNSGLIYHEDGERPTEVGVTVVDGFATTLSYGLDKKWAHILYLRGWELAQFRKVVSARFRRRFFGFESVNQILEDGGRIDAVSPPGMVLREVDTPADLEAAREVF